MTKTVPAPSSNEPIAPAPHAVEALALYEAVASGKHAALKPARVPS
jgi:hypothetical protein